MLSTKFSLTAVSYMCLAGNKQGVGAATNTDNFDTSLGRFRLNQFPQESKLGRST